MRAVCDARRASTNQPITHPSIFEKRSSPFISTASTGGRLRAGGGGTGARFGGEATFLFLCDFFLCDFFALSPRGFFLWLPLLFFRGLEGPSFAIAAAAAAAPMSARRFGQPERVWCVA